MTPLIVAHPGCALIRLWRIAKAKSCLSGGVPVPLVVVTVGVGVVG
ncbi:hypothetical protein AAFO90_21910 [Phaeobacter sp. CAU 1743]